VAPAGTVQTVGVRPNAHLGILRMRTSGCQAEHFVACWSVSPRIGWAVRNGLWVFGTQNYAELLRAAFACTHDGALAGAYPVISD